MAKVGRNRSRLLLVVSASALALGVMSTADAATSVQPAASSPGHSAVSTFSAANGVSCPRIAYCVAVGAYNTNDVIHALAGLWTGSAWSILPTPDQPGAVASMLNAVSCASASHCLAVGSYTDSTGVNWAFAEAWNGSTWAVADPPVPTGGTNAALNGVSCPSATFCMAVGSYLTSRLRPVPLVERWNGSSWRILRSRPPAGARESSLAAVSCANESACMATGYETGADFVRVTLAEAWSGTSWSVVPSPNPDGAQASSFNGVSCPSATRCRAVGTYDNSDFIAVALAESWDGTSWTVVPSPSPAGSPSSELRGVSCVTASRCLAVGDSYDRTRAAKIDALVETWNGSSWSIRSAPSPSTTSGLDGVSCAGVDTCLAAGSFFNSSGNYQLLAESWNGRSLAITNQDGVLAGVSCVTANYCVAVGSYLSHGSASTTLAEVWNGDTWRLSPPVDPVGSRGSYLTAISCLSVNQCVAVGYYFKRDNSRVTLIESWNGASWSIEPSPNARGRLYSVLYGISCVTAPSCLAVGSGIGRVLAEKWDGSTWSIVRSANPPNPAYAELTGIECSSATQCLAVGYDTDTHYHADVTLGEQWNGSVWSIVPSAAPGESYFRSSLLHGISCTSSVCLAVGEHERKSGSFATFTERWTGTEWVAVGSPSPSGTYSELSGISCVSSGSCLAVGTYYDHAGNFVPLGERWTGHAWHVVQNAGSTPLPSEVSYLLGVSCPTAVPCQATGHVRESDRPESTDEILVRLRAVRRLPRPRAPEFRRGTVSIRRTCRRPADRCRRRRPRRR